MRAGNSDERRERERERLLSLKPPDVEQRYSYSYPFIGKGARWDTKSPAKSVQKEVLTKGAHKSLWPPGQTRTRAAISAEEAVAVVERSGEKEMLQVGEPRLKCPPDWLGLYLYPPASGDDATLTQPDDATLKSSLP